MVAAMDMGTERPVSPIFQSASQAIHFAFLMEAYPPAPESQMAKVMRRLIQSMGITRSSTIDLGGLSPLEIQAQCAMIRAAVKTHLRSPESWVLQARYGINESDMEDGKPVLSFSLQRFRAIGALAKYLMVDYEGMTELSMYLVIARIMDNRVHKTTARKLADDFGKSHSFFIRLEKDLAIRLVKLERIAISNIEPIFIRHGVIDV